MEIIEPIRTGIPLSYSNGGMTYWHKVTSGTESFKSILENHSKGENFRNANDQ